MLLLVSAALAVVGPVGCSKAAKASVHLERANQYYKDGDSEKALIEYLNVLKLQRTNQVALARVGAIYFDRGALRSAVPLLMRAKLLAPDDVEVRRRLGRVYVQAGKLEEARAEAEAILAKDPRNEEAILILSRSAQDTNEVAQIQAKLAELRSRTGDNAALQMALGNLALRTGDPSAAETALKQAISLDPQSGRAKAALGGLYWAQGKTNEAGALFEEAARQGKPASPEQVRWAQYKLQTGASEEAKQILEAAAKADPYNAPVTITLGELALSETNYVECSNRVVKVLQQDPSSYEALLLRARLLRSQGDLTNSIEVLQRAQGLYPSSAQVAFELALSQLANRNLVEAINRLYSAITFDPRYPEANLLLAQLQMAQGDNAGAATTLNKFRSQRPDIPRTYLLLADACQGQQRYVEALSALDTYMQRVPKDPSAPLLKGLILRQQTKNTEARQAFEQARQLAPKDEAVLYQLVELDLVDKEYDKALRRVQQALQQSPKSPGCNYLLARVYLAQNKADDAEAALNKAIELGPNFSVAYSLLVDLYTARKDYTSALAKLDAFLKQRPDNTGALMLKGMIFERLADYPQAAVAYGAVLSGNSNVVLALNNLAYLQAEHLGDLDKARSLAARARQLAPEDASVADTLGWIEYKRGAYGAAMPLLQESAAKMPTQAEVQYHLGMTAYMMGKEAEARTALTVAASATNDFSGKAAIAPYLAILNADAAHTDAKTLAALEERCRTAKNDLIAWTRLAAAYEAQGAYDKARNAYETALQINPGAYDVTSRLALLYGQHLNNLGKALELAKEARKLAPNDPAVVHVLGRLAFESGDQAWAYSLLQEAGRGLPGKPEVQYDLAWAAYGLGKTTEADQAMQNVVATNSPANLAAAAKWFLTMNALAREPASLAQAEPQIQTLLKSVPDHAPALMALGLLRQQQGRLDEARSVFEGLLARYSRFTPAMKQLAIIYADQGGNDAKAYDIAVKAREAFPGDELLAKALGKLAYRRGDYRYAAQLLREGARKRPEDADLLFHLGMSCQQLKQTDEARTALEQALRLGPNAAFAPEATRVLAELKKG